MEIRIKYSEGCYQSLPYLHINDLFELNISNSFIIYITNKDSSSFGDNLIKLINNNRLIVITSGEINKGTFHGFSKNSNLSFISIPSASSFYSFIPTTLTGQLLSYYTAVELDKRKIYFQHLINSIESNRDCIYLLICFIIYLLIYLFTYLFAYLCTFLFCLFTYLFIYLFLYPSIDIYLHMFIYLSFYLLFIYL